MYSNMSLVEVVGLFSRRKGKHHEKPVRHQVPIAVNTIVWLYLFSDDVSR